MKSASSRFFSLFLLLFLFASSTARAGKLDDFEGGAGSGGGSSGGGGGSGGGSYDYDEDDDDDCVEDLEDIFPCMALYIVVEASKATIEYTRKLRKPGDLVVPYARADGFYQRVQDADVHGFGGRAEAGWAFIGVGFEYLRYREENPDDKLELWAIEALWRFSIYKSFRLDAAIGGRGFKGNSEFDGTHGGFSVGIYPHTIIGIEGDFRWAEIGGNALGDYQAAFVFRHPAFRYVFIRTNYRWLTLGEETIHGPTVGLGAVF